MKYCRRCDTTKSLEEFYNNRAQKDGKTNYCKICHRESQDQEKWLEWRATTKPWMTNDKDKLKEYRLRYTCKQRGITRKQYDEILTEQQYSCAICKESFGERICIDHDHKTGKVRGLLCDGCNNGIARLRDNPEYARAAAEYLETHQYVD